VSAFVDECLAEWRRLGVPGPVANEMAADLAADLAEAEAEGISPEEVLGSGVFDARSFAAAWAIERGVIAAPAPAQPPAARRSERRWLALAALCLVVAFVGLMLTIVGSPTREAHVAVAAGSNLPRVRVVVPRGNVRPGGPAWVGPNARVIFPPLGRVQRQSFTFDVGPGPDLRPIGVLLLVAGLAGAIASAIVWRRRLAA